MKIWIQYEEKNSEFLVAICGGVKKGIYLDGLLLDSEPLAYVVAAVTDQGFVPVTRVAAASAMKRMHGGLAIIYGKLRIKTKPDNETLVIEPDGKLTEKDNAIERVLVFFKRHKIPSNL
jgi:hypothetical protein